MDLHHFDQQRRGCQLQKRSRAAKQRGPKRYIASCRELGLINGNASLQREGEHRELVKEDRGLYAHCSVSRVIGMGEERMGSGGERQFCVYHPLYRVGWKRKDIIPRGGNKNHNRKFE
jgi:hypothetical protein